jgi:membrane protease YdiL (CAAX protease family)
MVWWFLPEKLFFVVKENPGLWLGSSLFYAVVSVYPQELIYRHFFYWRYSHLLSPRLFLALNALLFSLAHTLFMNGLVFALTLAGGFLFANTYRKTQSLVVTSIEHAVYGLWLYTVGLGEMLAFPGP